MEDKTHGFLSFPYQKSHLKHRKKMLWLLFILVLFENKITTDLENVSIGNRKQDEKTTYRMEENICKWYNQQRVNFQNLQTAHTAQYQKNKQPNPKMGRRPK